jgi:hypothetical protein
MQKCSPRSSAISRSFRTTAIQSSQSFRAHRSYVNEDDGITHAVRSDPRKYRDSGMATDDACPRAMRYGAREREPVRPVVARVLCYPARIVVAAARVSSRSRGRDSTRHIYVPGHVSPARKGRVEILGDAARRCARPIDGPIV